jgi:alpha-1,3(6)-mannosylglycoprotein beta-1,6-N-acetyl-glucosaminyltransferase
VVHPVPLEQIPSWKRSSVKRPTQKDSLKFLLWGKLYRYFDDRTWKLARKIMDTYPELQAIATISDAKPGGLPSFVDNKGIVNSTVWKSLLAESAFIIGFGDPVMGPTVLESIAQGCVYLNPKYSQPKTLPMNVRMPLDSQHPQARDIYGGEPYVYDVNLSDENDVLLAVGRVLKNYDAKRIHPIIPYDYTIEAVTERVAHDLDDDFVCRALRSSH